jgi:hypothetical protein
MLAVDRRMPLFPDPHLDVRASFWIQRAGLLTAFL